MRRIMSAVVDLIIMMGLCGVLVGCDYTVPLVNRPEIGIDSGVIGLWQGAQGEGQREGLLVLPLNKQEYMVSFPASSTNAMFARACLCRTARKNLVQLEWFGTAQAKLPEDKRVFQFVTYSVTGDTLTLRLLNADLVKRDVKSSEELAKAIANSEDNPNLFRGEMVFTKVKN
jgi:hypothetical protein